LFLALIISNHSPLTLLYQICESIDCSTNAVRFDCEDYGVYVWFKSCILR